MIPTTKQKVALLHSVLYYGSLSYFMWTLPVNLIFHEMKNPALEFLLYIFFLAGATKTAIMAYWHLHRTNTPLSGAKLLIFVPFANFISFEGQWYKLDNIPFPKEDDSD